MNNADVILSYDEALLGDPSFPGFLISTTESEWIHRAQMLYEKYTRLHWSNLSDRPIAIAGLERRLLRAMNAQGAYGVIDIGRITGSFHMSLLWCRGSDMDTTGLVRIGDVPSWSWMAYSGSIDYLRVELDTVEWENIKSPWSPPPRGPRTTDTPAPWSTSSRSLQEMVMFEARSSISILVEAREFSYSLSTESQRESQIFMDNLDTLNTSYLAGSRCVVLGKEKGIQPIVDKIHLVLIIKLRTTNSLDDDNTVSLDDDNTVWERVGAGYLLGKFIELDTLWVVVQ